MSNVEMVNYVYELITEELDKSLNRKPDEYHSEGSRSFTELCAMRTVAHMFRTLMAEDWPEDYCRDYIKDMLNF